MRTLVETLVRKLSVVVGLVGLASLWAAPTMASSVNLTMTDIGLSNQLGGAYIGPFTVEPTGTTNTFKVICDDVLADTYIGESWTANMSSISDLAGKFNDPSDPVGSLKKYNEVGFLATALFDFSSATPCPIGSCAGINNAGDIQFALWQVFGAPTAFSYLTPGSLDWTNAGLWLTLAQNQTYAPGAYSNLVIYTPTSCITGPGCAPGGTSNLPQEFIGRTTVPEPGTLPMLGIGMLGIAFYGRRKAVRRYAAL